MSRAAQTLDELDELLEGERQVRGSLCVRIGDGSGGGFIRCGSSLPPKLGKLMKSGSLKIGALGGGVNATYLVESDSGEKGVFKIVDSEWDRRNTGRAVAAHKVLDDLGVRTHEIAEVSLKGELESGKRGSRRVHKDPDGVAVSFLSGKTPRSLLADHRAGKDRRLDKVRGKDCVRGAVADVLIGNIDRHGGNVLVTEKGRVQFIDHDSALTSGNSSKSTETRINGPAVGGVNSIFLPQTKYGQKVKGTPLEVFDYTKHVGEIGKRYPRELKRVIGKISRMEPKDIEKKYGAGERESRALKQRAEWMRTLGFEDALARIQAEGSSSFSLKYN